MKVSVMFGALSGKVTMYNYAVNKKYDFNASF